MRLELYVTKQAMAALEQQYVSFTATVISAYTFFFVFEFILISVFRLSSSLFPVSFSNFFVLVHNRLSQRASVLPPEQEQAASHAVALCRTAGSVAEELHRTSAALSYASTLARHYLSFSLSLSALFFLYLC